MPLSELEEALLVAAGAGFSGLALWDQTVPLPYRFSEGRTYSSTCRGRRTALFFTNDQGVYVIDPAAGAPSKMREVEGVDARQKVLSLYRDPARPCSKAVSDFLAASRRSPGTICGIRTCRARRCSCRCAT
jgi:hypothetical protein